jgi:hypothetical protein
VDILKKDLVEMFYIVQTVFKLGEMKLKLIGMKEYGEILELLMVQTLAL